MSGIFQGYTNSNGRVRAAVVTKVPAGSANDRGMIVAGNRVIPYLLDGGQPRTLHDGIAFDAVTGLLLAAETPFGATNISMGGLLVDSRGAVMLTDGNPQVIHQGVGLQNNGSLSIESEPIATFIAHLRNNVASTAGPGDFERASDGLYRGADGVWRIAGPNEPRFEDGQLLMEPASTNVFWNSDAPVTQTRTLGTTGEWTISCYGSGSVTSSNGTGVATGHGTALDGSPVTIDVTTAGTFTFTVSGSLDLVQVENKSVLTSPIITQGASASRDVDTLQYPAASGPGQILTVNPGLNNFAEGWFIGGGAGCVPTIVRESSVRLENVTQTTCLVCRKDDVTFTQGKWYKIDLSVLEYTAGPASNLTILLGGVSAGIEITSSGNHEFYYYMNGVPSNTRQQLNATNPDNMTTEIGFFQVTELTDFFNQEQGMAFCTVKFRFDPEDMPAGVSEQEGILSLQQNATESLMRYLRTASNTNSFQTNQETGSNPNVRVDNIQKGNKVIVATRWSNAANELQIGAKKESEPWLWSAVEAYGGAFTVSDNSLYIGELLDYPFGFQDAVIYDEDKGRDWIEANYP